MTLDDIKRPVTKEMQQFETYFRQNLKSPTPLLSLITNYVFRRKGKQMRPLLVFLSAAATGGTTQSSFAAASLIELLHNASLVHDDIVDDTYQRRGQWSVNAIWNSKVAVLVGDFFLARGLSIALDGNHYDILRTVTDAVRELSVGELNQIEHARHLDITEDTYYDVIRQKTATLIAACTKAGAQSANADEATTKALYDYGQNLGMAFQIKDDIFDYQPTGLLGKPSGNDIKEKKLTLPLIHALEKATNNERKHMLRHIATHAKDDSTLTEAINLIHQHDGINYSIEAMTRYGKAATPPCQTPMPNARSSPS